MTLLRRRRWGGLDPFFQTQFAGGEFSPLNLPGLRIWMGGTDPTTMYQDSALTTPVANDADPVGGWVSKAPTVWAAVQANAALRHTYQTNEVNGLSVCQYGGDTHRLDFSGDALNVLRNVGSATVIICQTTGLWFTGFEARVAGSSSARFQTSHGISTNYKGMFSGRRLDADATQSVQFYSYSAAYSTVNHFSIMSADVHWETGYIGARLNGSLVAENSSWSSLGNTQDTASNAVFMGQYRNSKVAHFLLYQPALTIAQTLQVEEWIAEQLTLTAPQFVCDGDSLTAGHAASPGYDYPNQLLGLLGGSWIKYNDGVNNDTVANMLTVSPTRTEYLSSVLRQKNVYVLFAGTNDLVNVGDPPATVYANIAQFCADRQAYGWQVLVCTITPRDYAGDPPGTNADIATVNASIRANYTSWADGLVDLAIDYRLDDPADSTYFNADKLHLTDAGYGVVAELVKAQIDILPTL